MPPESPDENEPTDSPRTRFLTSVVQMLGAILTALLLMVVVITVIRCAES